MNDLTAPPPGAIPSFAALVGVVDGGRLAAEADSALERVVTGLTDALQEGRKVTGAITIQVQFLADRDVIETTGRVTVREPSPKRGRSILFLAGRFLARQDPRQADLPLRVPQSAPTTLRVIPSQE